MCGAKIQTYGAKTQTYNAKLKEVAPNKWRVQWFGQVLRSVVLSSLFLNPLILKENCPETVMHFEMVSTST